MYTALRRACWEL